MCKPGYLDLESGYSRLPDGLLHVAAWTTMPGCKGAMVEWWFGFLETTEQLVDVTYGIHGVQRIPMLRTECAPPDFRAGP